MIKSDSDTLVGEDAMYPALSQAMSAMVDSQTKMNQLVKNINEYQNGIKDHLAVFKNHRTNVPYIKLINDIPYWFINGKNTGQKIYYDLEFESVDNAINAKTSLKEDGLSVELSHNLFLGKEATAGDATFENTSIDDFGKSVTITLPTLNINSSGHVCSVKNKQLTIAIPNYNDNHLMRNDGSNYIASLDLVAHSITPKWTIKNQSDNIISTSNVASLNVENGAKVDFHGEWSYVDKGETTKLPTSCSGSWGNELPGVNIKKELNAYSLISNKSYSQTINAPKSGLEVKNNKVVKATGDDTSTKTVSVTFKPRIYYGATTLASISSLEDLKTLGGTELNTTFAKTFNADCGTGKYIYIAYPTSISGEPFFKIGGLDFTNLVETTVEITNEYGLKVNYNIRRVFDIQTTSKTIVVTKK
jgi:hypothetical protein